MELLTSLLSAGLFLAALVLYLIGARRRVWMDTIPRIPESFSNREYGRVLLLCLGSLILHTAVVSGARLLTGENGKLEDTFYLYTGLDTPQYFKIAQHGYTVAEEGKYLSLVFFPGYAVLIGLLELLLPEVLSGYLAAWLPFLLAGPVLYRLFRLDYDERKSLRILLWLCLIPGAVFYSYPMSESLFLLCSAGAILCGRTRRWFAAGVCGFLAAFTRSPGLLLVVPLGLELLEQHQGLRQGRWKNVLRDGCWLLLIPLATCIYLWLNVTITGEPLTFLTHQREHWSQRLGWFFKTAGMQMDYAIREWGEDPENFWGLWVSNLVNCFSCLTLMLLAGRKLRLSQGAWFFFYFAVCCGATWLLSGPRYMAVFFPMAILVEEAPGPRWLKGLLMGLGAIAYTVFFGLRWGVW